MVRFASDVGTKYAQDVNNRTPSYAKNGVRMEDCSETTQVPNGLVICVADGHGSTKTEKGVVVGGRECADVACALVRRNANQNPYRIFSACQQAIEKIHVPGQMQSDDGLVRVVTESGAIDVSSRGCTLAVCKVKAGMNSWFAWVGDSVGIRVSGDNTFLLGRPHTTANREEVERARRARVSTKDRYFTYKTGGSTQRIMLSRSLGHVGHEFILKTPEVDHFVPLDGDRILIASDGLWDAIDAQRAAQILRASHTEAEACAALVEVCRSGKGRKDNVVVACHFVKRVACCAIQ